MIYEVLIRMIEYVSKQAKIDSQVQQYDQVVFGSFQISDQELNSPR